MKFIITDAGSTKTAWATLVNGEMQRTFTGSGINPSLMTKEELRKIIHEQMKPLLKDDPVDAIYFYGAGCKAEVVEKIRQVFLEVIPAAQINIYSDMLGAARSVLGTQRGIACILGTGSNSCLYDGENITANVSPLGFILGDEGSGASLGRLLVGEVLKGKLMYLRDDLFSEMGLDESSIIERVYRRSAPNRFLASLAPFLHQHRTDVNVKELIIAEFRRFVKRNIEHYNSPELPISFVGSIAWWFKQELKEAVEIEGYRFGNVIQSPLEGLLNYHAVNLQ